ncbi:MAG: OstA-like protein [Bacteroidota bacterium]
MKKYVLLTGIVILSVLQSYGQNGLLSGGKIQVLNANTFELVTKGKSRIKKLIGQVQLKQDNTLLYCDSAYLFDETDYVEAYDNVRINHSDSVNFYGDILKYNGQKRTARLEKNVRMVDNGSTLTCNELDFDFNLNKASYFTGGKLISAQNTLTSRIGHYYTNSKELYFKKDVKLKGQEFDMVCDTLKYQTSTRIATFYGNTIITSETDTVYCQAGTYHTEKQSGILLKRAKIRSAENTLIADTIVYDRKKKYSKALGNIIILDTINKTLVLGNVAELFGLKKSSYVTKDALAFSLVDKDTLMIWADTIYTYQKSAENARDILKAFYKVRIYKKDLQAICDSMVYIKQDSAMTLYKQPVLWSDANQITGDTILFYINNRKLDSMYIRNNSFVASKINAAHYNQIKGKDMKAYFRESKIDYIQVYGNGQSIYYPQEDSAYIGVNVIDCSEMKFRFESGKIKSAQFITQPDAIFYPLNEMKPEQLKLKGFKWLYKLKPRRRSVNNIKM